MSETLYVVDEAPHAWRRGSPCGSLRQGTPSRLPMRQSVHLRLRGAMRGAAASRDRVRHDGAGECRRGAEPDRVIVWDAVRPAGARIPAERRTRAHRERRAVACCSGGGVADCRRFHVGGEACCSRRCCLMSAERDPEAAIARARRARARGVRPRVAADLPGRVRGRRQDVRDAQRGAAP